MDLLAVHNSEFEKEQSQLGAGSFLWARVFTNSSDYRRMTPSAMLLGSPRLRFSHPLARGGMHDPNGQERGVFYRELWPKLS